MTTLRLTSLIGTWVIITSLILQAQHPSDALAGEDAAPATQPAGMPSIIQELPDYTGDLMHRKYLTGDWSVGYYHANINDNTLPGLNLHSEQGVEVFYNVEITPWLHITPDLQVIVNPGGGFRDRDVALVYGLRAQMSF